MRGAIRLSIAKTNLISIEPHVVTATEGGKAVSLVEFYAPQKPEARVEVNKRFSVVIQQVKNARLGETVRIAVQCVNKQKV